MLIFTWGLEGLAAGKTNIGLPNFHLCHLCDICNKYFTQKTHIRTHKHSFHEGKIIDVIHVINSFQKNGNLKTHKDSIHVGKNIDVMYVTNILHKGIV